MTFASLITNQAGKSVAYGYEFIPMVIYAQHCTMSCKQDQITTIPTITEYSEELFFLIRHISGNSLPHITLKRSGNGYVNIVGAGGDSSVSHGSCTFNIYLCGRAKKIPETKYGIRIYDELGKLAFSGDNPPIQIKQVLLNQYNFYPEITGKQASVPALFRWTREAPIGNGDALEVTEAIVVSNTQPTRAIPITTFNYFIPGGGEMGYVRNYYHFNFLSGDTTHADWFYQLT